LQTKQVEIRLLRQADSNFVLQIHPDDLLTLICQECFRILKEFEEFQSKATSAQETIKRALKRRPLEISKAQVTNEKLPIEEDSIFTEHIQIEDFVTEDFEEKEDKLECEFCLKIYKRRSHLTRHIESLHKDRKIVKTRRNQRLTCILCGKKFIKQETYEYHLQEVSCVALDSPKCRICGEILPDLQRLKTHFAELHSDGRQHCCPICFKTFPSASNRNSHIETHNPENHVSCGECNQKFKSVLYLRKHTKSVHTKSEKICLICGKTFDSQQKFEYHVKAHDAVKKYKCDHKDCDKSFMQHHHLENHKATHSGIHRFLCYKCGKEFKQECNLKTHLKSHESEGCDQKTFKCEYEGCHKSFNSPTAFRSHKQTHGKVSQCPECGKKFALKSQLRVHFQAHFSSFVNEKCEKKFKCSEENCGKSFRQARSVNYHMRTSHGIGEAIVKSRKASTSIFYCDFCSESFRLQSLLKRHLISHVEEEKQSRKYQCDECDARFKRPEHLSFM
jgi:KRAB domain-containing zinc finger protein